MITMKKATIFRIITYAVGLLVLALGLTLNTKAGLGVSPIISVAYSVSIITNYNFGNTTMVLYIIFVFAEMILHYIRDRRYEEKSGEALKHANKVNRKLVVLMDVLQIPFSIIFTRFLNIFGNIIPEIYSEGKESAAQMTLRFVVLIIALICTGVGAATTLNMRIVPNPGDGIVQAIADCIHKSVGFTKNCVDVCSVLITVIISMVCARHLVGVGIGTIFAVIGVGRIIAIFNYCVKDKLTSLAGIEE